MTTVKYYGCLVAWVCAAANASGQTDAERRFRELVSPKLVLGSDRQSSSEQFQLEIRSRVVDKSGPTVEQRIVLERAKEKVAALMLTPNGFPTSLLVGKTFLVIKGDEVKAFQGGRFHCRGGSLGNKRLGISFTYAGDAAEESRITVDFNALSEMFMVAGATYGWDGRAKRAWVSTPSGAQLSLNMDPTGNGQFPIKAAFATVPVRRDKSIYIEVAISNIYVETPPRTLLETGDWGDLPIVRASFEEVDASHLSDVGASFDEDDRSARRLGRIMLAGFKTDERIRVSKEDQTRVRDWLDSAEGASESQIGIALDEIRNWGAMHVWGELQEASQIRGRRFRLDYNRHTVAARTEIVLGPGITLLLRDRLAAIAADEKLTVTTRADALNLLGRFGLPLLSELLTHLDENLARPNSGLPAPVFASFRVSQGRASDEDVASLHAAVAENSLPPEIVTQAIEALACVGELAQHVVDPELVFEFDRDDSNAVPRRLRAFAFAEEGQVALLGRLGQVDDPRLRIVILSALGDAILPGDKHWQALVAISRATALDETKTTNERFIANRIVHFDAATLKSSFSDAFFRSAMESNDTNLMYGAMWNLTKLGRLDPCFDAINGKLGGVELKTRADIAQLLAGVGILAWKQRERLPPSFWKALNTVFADSALEVRGFGPTIVMLLLGEGVQVPDSYITPVAKTGLAARDPTQLATACVVLVRLSASAYSPPVPAELRTQSEVMRWISANPETVKAHLRSWHDDRRRPVLRGTEE